MHAFICHFFSFLPSDMNLERFIPIYPRIEKNKSTFQYEIARKKEFHDNKMEPTLEDIEPEGLFRQQKLISRFISPYTTNNKMLLVHEMGTGKTYASTAVAENFKRMSESHNEIRDRALVLVKSDLLARNVITQLAAKYTTYKPSGSASSLTQRIYDGRMKTLVSKSYELNTFEKFLKIVSPTQ